MGGYDLFVQKRAPDGTLVYSTLLGGTGDDTVFIGGCIAVDREGRVYAAAGTLSSDFPVRNAWQPAKGGASDGVIARLNKAGDDLEYSTYFGGSGTDAFGDVAIDTAGKAASTNKLYNFRCRGVML
jgi:hypothetical protein